MERRKHRPDFSPGDKKMKSPSRVLILTPTALPDITGNAVTVERWRQGLIRAGWDVAVAATRDRNIGELTDLLSRKRPDVLHIHHLVKSGAVLKGGLPGDTFRNLPVVATPAGTDLNLDVRDTVNRNILAATCARADIIVFQNQWLAQELITLFPFCRTRLRYVPKAFFWLGNRPYDLRRRAGAGPGEILFFLPGGIRPVKGILEGLRALAEVHRRRPRLRAVFAGPALDRDYSDRFVSELGGDGDFASWLPAIDPRAMRRAYQGADVVLNTSLSEGLPNALLEGIAAGKPLLATDIPGNRWPVLGANGARPCGLLFAPRHREDFIAQALRIIDDDMLRAALARACRERAAAWPPPEQEITGLVAAYDQALAVRSGG
ncbi:MAG TPA: glycosyltransferase family 4 protein [Syntrophales bacterium]|jgi:glycosyltransferase involved in cell wall biosynthesis|nr:glycosyltransferase family 4 protein [Syntrophales bacterium]HRR47180.1 glycosyltransferase family 4 protein [Syntrophales bacterium]